MNQVEKAVVSALTSSRASPLPHLTVFYQKNAVECGSGLARERSAAVCQADRSVNIKPGFC
ncbi:hypothetical protein E3W21_20160 [Pseudomonas sp. F01002]|nr:hypothetical protein CUN63_28970 [Pseudomonas sp. ACM7]TFB37994.1 hypothetical protein E3W21_20160 [Pseudomonas sp. F01002]